MNPKRIVIDGKTYLSVDEMPEHVRKQYEQAMNSLKDENKNQIPDILETRNLLSDKDNDGVPDAFENISSHSIVMGGMKIIVDGKEFNSIEELHRMFAPNMNKRWADGMRTKMGCRTYWKECSTLPNRPEISRQVLEQKYRVAPNLYLSPQPLRRILQKDGCLC